MCVCERESVYVCVRACDILALAVLRAKYEHLKKSWHERERKREKERERIEQIMSRLFFSER